MQTLTSVMAWGNIGHGKEGMLMMHRVFAARSEHLPTDVSAAESSTKGR